jgi:hypothetical protein
MAFNYTKGSKDSLGMDIMRRINEGTLKKAPAREIEAVKAKIIENCGEIIEQGARIRPLMQDGKQVGWCRGIHISERQLLKHWIKEPNDYVASTLMLGTTFSKAEVDAMSSFEIRSLAEVVQRMSQYDSSLVPYLSAYSTTYYSENLWYSKGENLASWENRTITMPDGKVMRIMLPPDHARAWVSLCTYREQAKRRVAADFNALFIVRPWAGKSADPIQSELNRIARSLDTNALEPWEQVVRPERPTVDVNDGWGHPGDSVEDLRRELKGMMEGDKHERVMEAWQKQMAAEEEERKKKMVEDRKKRGTDRIGIVSEKIEVFTEQQMREIQKALKEGRLPRQAVRREDTEVAPSDRQFDKARKYR